jgi:hypothetical protein
MRKLPANEVSGIGTLPLALSLRRGSGVSPDKRLPHSSTRSNLSKIVLFVASGYQRRSTYDWTTSGPERASIINTTFAYVSSTHDAAITAVPSAVSPTGSCWAVRPTVVRSLGTVALRTADVIDESV